MRMINFYNDKGRKYFLLLITLLCFQWNVNAQTGTEYYPQDISVKSGDVTIEGTLHVPKRDGKFPVMIFVPGSGRITRQDLGFALSIFNGLNIATFIYDKRGLGESTGQYTDINAANSIEAFEQRASDVIAIVNALKNQENVDPDKIGLIGSSQGSWIIPIVASRMKDIALSVCISGAVSSVGISDYYESLAEGSHTIDEAVEQLNNYSGERGFDPYKSIQQMSNSGLWIYGGQDRSNPTKEDIRILSEIKESKNKPFTIHYYPTYNHEMIDTETGSFGTEVIPALREWVVETFDE